MGTSFPQRWLSNPGKGERAGWGKEGTAEHNYCTFYTVTKIQTTIASLYIYELHIAYYILLTLKTQT